MSDELTLNAKAKAKRRSIINDLEEFDDVVLPSSIPKKVEEKKVKPKKEICEDTSEWLDELLVFTSPKVKKSKKKSFKGFTREDNGNKKRKKTNKQGELKNYQKEFEPELALLKNLYMAQSKFTDNLQRKYDDMEKAKSSARGVGKFTTDLIGAINTARATTLQIMDKTISTKKTIAELNVKERKEFGSKTNSDQDNNAEFASTYLKQMMAAGRNNIIQSGYMGMESGDNYNLFPDSDDSSIIDSIEESIGDDLLGTKNEYLKYENAGIEISVVRDIDGEWDFIATDKDGKVATDYPLPMRSKMTFNPSVGVAVDEFGRKYPLMVQ